MLASLLFLAKQYLCLVAFASCCCCATRPEGRFCNSRKAAAVFSKTRQTVCIRIVSHKANVAAAAGFLARNRLGTCEIEQPSVELTYGGDRLPEPTAAVMAFLATQMFSSELHVMQGRGMCLYWTVSMLCCALTSRRHDSKWTSN